MGFDIRAGLLTTDFTSFLEKKLSSAFADKTVKLSNIKGGIFNDFTIDDFSILNKTAPGSSDKTASPAMFSSDKIIIKYNLMDLVFRHFEKFGGIYFISPVLNYSPGQSGQGFMPVYTASLTQKLSDGQSPIQVHILNGSIAMPGKEALLSNISGSVDVSASELSFHNLSANFQGFPLMINGKVRTVSGKQAVRLRILVNEKYCKARIDFKSSDREGIGAIQGVIKLFDRFSLHFNGKLDMSSGEDVQIKDLSIENWLKLDGYIDFTTRSSKFIVRPKKGFIKVMTNLNDKRGLSIFTELDHLDIFGLDLLSHIDINTSFGETNGSGAILRGTLRTQNVILNYKPFKDVRASWLLKKDVLFINTLELGDEYRLFGKIELSSPYNMDLKLAMNNVDLRDWSIFSESEEANFLSGIMNGKVEVRGPFAKPVTKGALVVSDGNIDDVRFKALNFNLAGKGPIINISDSRIIKEGGVLFINGEVDLAKLGKRNIFENVKVTTDQKTIVWEGWDISKSPSEVNLNRQVGDEFKVHFKTNMNDTASVSNGKENEMGLDYKIKQGDSINVRVKEDGAFVGVEHKVKF